MISIVPGGQYLATAWVRGQDATGTTVVNVSWYNDQGAYMSGSDSATLNPGDTDWTELEATGDGPARSRLRGDLAQERRQLGRRLVRRRDLDAVNGLTSDSGIKRFDTISPNEIHNPVERQGHGEGAS